MTETERTETERTETERTERQALLQFCCLSITLGLSVCLVLYVSYCPYLTLYSGYAHGACAWIQEHREYGLDKVNKKLKKAIPRSANTATIATLWGRAQVSFGAVYHSAYVLRDWMRLGADTISASYCSDATTSFSDATICSRDATICSSDATICSNDATTSSRDATI